MQSRLLIGMAIATAALGAARFKGGWAFFGFDGAGPAAQFPDNAPCYACHQAHAAADITFVQSYPTLLPVAQKLGTLNPAYVAETAKASRRRMREAQRSGCPINLTLEVLGDRWSLLILRDIIFGGRRRFGELMRSEERIASNILADRLRTLVEAGLLTRADDPDHRQKAVYSLTEASIALVPVLAEIGAWGTRWLPVTDAFSLRARLLEAGGAPLVERFMAELRHEHLGVGSPPDRSVRAELQASFEAAVAQTSSV
jgi:DNA-binding HxlR family transcriptional regulator